MTDRISEENTMDRSTKALARRVAAGSKTALPDFKAAMLMFGWEGRRGLGVVNAEGWHHKSWAALAADVLENGVQLHYAAPDQPATDEELDAIEEAEAEEMAEDEARAREGQRMHEAEWAPSMGQSRNPLDVVAEPDSTFRTDHVEREPFTYFYSERTITQPFRTERIVTIIGVPR